MSKTRKQHIETLTRFTNPTPKGKCYTHEQLMDAVKYAIDHLSREWVSRKTHRKKVDELNKSVKESHRDIQNICDSFQKEIDHLKAEKDRLLSIIERHESLSENWKKQNRDLLEDWEKESVLRQKKDNQVISMGIVAVFLFIVLIISLLN